MVKSCGVILLLTILAALTDLRAAEVHVEIPASIPPNAWITAKLTVTGDASITGYDLPSVEGLELRASQSFHGITIINGKREESVAFEVHAMTVGEYTIPAFAVQLDDGSSASTRAAIIHVAPANPRLKGLAYAEASFEPSTVVIGQPTRLVYRLFLRQGVRALDIEFGPPPDATRLEREPHQESGVTTDAAGERWDAYTLTWDITFAESGQFTASGQQGIMSSQGFFDSRESAITIRSAHILVTSLPTDGRPADFSGVIGPLHLTARLERTRITADEGTVLAVEVRGPQATTMRQLEIQVPAGLRSYPKDPTDDGESRTFRRDLVPTAAGTYTIAIPGVSYYDPETRAFLRTAGASVILMVTTGHSHQTTPVAAATMLPSVIPIPFRPMPLHLTQALPSTSAAPWVLGGGVLIGALLGVAPQAPALLRSRRRRGRDLIQAIAAGHLDEAARRLEALRSDLDDPRLIRAAAELRHELDIARFGSLPLSPAASELMHLLENVR